MTGLTPQAGNPGPSPLEGRGMILAATRRLAPLVAVVLLAAACTGGGDVKLTAEFPDVLNLVERSMVRTNGVQVGTITGIELTDENTARVTMSVRDDTGLPSRVRAELRQTNLLGERYVELVPVGGEGDLASGRVESAVVIGDLEDLVMTGTELFGLLSADRLAAMIQAGAITFGGRGGTLGGAIADIETFVATFEGDAETITRLIDNLHDVVGTLAREAQANAEAVTVLAANAEALKAEDDRLVDALTSLRDLTEVGGRILAEHAATIDDSVRRLRRILEAVTAIDGALQNFLTWLPIHNLHVPNGIFLEHAQLWNDDIGCGPTHEDTGNPSRDCTPPNPGERGEPPYPLDITDCTRDHEGCGYPAGEEPETTNDHPNEDD